MNDAAGDHPGFEDAAARSPGPGSGAWTAQRPPARPGEQDVEADQRARLRHGQRMAELTLEQLWLRFFAVGGDVGLVELEAYLAGLLPLPDRQRDMLAQAVNERLDELLLAARVPYSHAELVTPQAGAQLDGLVGLLADSHLAPPDQLAALAATAYAALGIAVTMYLVDHDQQLLVPAPVGGAATSGPARHAPSAPPLLHPDRDAVPPSVPRSVPQPLSIDATLAGRAFRQVETIVSENAGHRRLWLPLLDGTQRLGVLDVELPGPAGPADGTLHEQCRQLASLVGQLVTSMGERGDGLDAVRRTRPRAPSAELVWQLLPPPTAETDSFALSGWLQPADIVGGDTFDYALSVDRAGLAMFDAMGHGLPAGLLAAAAVSAYRAARRNGQDLQAQARAVDASLRALGEEGSFVTGFLGELDLTTGRLSYLSAGHPPPMLLRGGKVVRMLTGGRRLPFGLDLAVRADRPVGESVVLGREDLEPGDWLAVHTDGVTEARDEAGEFFGDARLADLLHSAIAAGQPPPETARRLGRAVLEHQHGQLQDDATVLLSCWQPR